MVFCSEMQTMLMLLSRLIIGELVIGELVFNNK